MLERLHAVHVRRQLRHAHARVRGEAAIDLVEIDLLPDRAARRRNGSGLVAGSTRLTTRPPIVTPASSQLLDRPRGFLDRQPLGDQHQHERARARAEQPRAELAQPLEPLDSEIMTGSVASSCSMPSMARRDRDSARIHASISSGMRISRRVCPVGAVSKTIRSKRSSSPRISAPMRSNSAISSAPGMLAARSICRLASLRMCVAEQAR